MNTPFPSTTRIRGHQLALRASATPGGLTPAGLEDGIIALKDIGYGAIVVVPATWSPELNAATAAEISLKHQFPFTVCGFLNGASFNPLTADSISASKDEVLRQLEIHSALQKAGCTDDLVCGPLGTGWMIPGFNLDRYRIWLKWLDDVAQDRKIRLAIEVLNATESPSEADFATLVGALADTGASHTGIHFDTGHAKSRGLKLNDFSALAKSVLMFEFANVGRAPLSWHRGINFPGYIKRLGELSDDVLVAVEPFDIEVINVFGLSDLCDTKLDGLDCSERDLAYLVQHGVVTAQEEANEAPVEEGAGATVPA